MPSTPQRPHGRPSRRRPDPVGVLRRRWWMAVACVVLLSTAVYAYSSRQAKVYEVTLVAEGGSESPIVSVGDAAIISTGHAALAAGYVRTPQVARETRRALGDRQEPAPTTVTVDGRTGWLTLTATSTDPDAAIATARAVLRGIERTLRSVAARQIDDAIDNTERVIATTRDPVERQETSAALRDLRSLRDAPREGFRVVEQPSSQVVAPHPGRNAVLALVLALLLSPALMLLAERFDRRVRRDDELESRLGAPLLASLPAPAPAGTRAAAARELQIERLRDSLVHFELGVPLRSLLVASALPDEGRTTTATDLAVAFARAGRRVVFVEADLRAGEEPPAPGLTEVLAGAELGVALRLPAAEGGIALLPRGAPAADPAVLLGTERMGRVLEELGREFDLVVVDAPPLLTVPGTLPLLRQVSGVLCLARLGHTPRDAVSRMARIIDAAGGRILGAVATGVRGAGRGRPAVSSEPKPLDSVSAFG